MLLGLPNPAVSPINIQLEKADKVLFYVYSLDGKLVQSGTFTELNNQLNVNELSAGLYIIQLAGESVKGNAKFVKM